VALLAKTVNWSTTPDTGVRWSTMAWRRRNELKKAGAGKITFDALRTRFHGVTTRHKRQHYNTSRLTRSHDVGQADGKTRGRVRRISRGECRTGDNEKQYNTAATARRIHSSSNGRAKKQYYDTWVTTAWRITATAHRVALVKNMWFRLERHRDGGDATLCHRRLKNEDGDDGYVGWTLDCGETVPTLEVQSRHRGALQCSKRCDTGPDRNTARKLKYGLCIQQA